jgi:hypothetical protein
MEPTDIVEFWYGRVMNLHLIITIFNKLNKTWRMLLESLLAHYVIHPFQYFLYN